MELRRAAFTLFVIALGVRAADVEFFEKKVRPVLAQKCYGCHSSKVKSPMGGLQLDSPDALRKIVVAGDPDASRLVQALSWKHELKMPPQGKLPDDEIGDVIAWIRQGAAIPEQVAPTENSSKFWAFQPVREPQVPRVPGAKSPIDAFILAKLKEKSLTPAPSADKRTLLRRVTFDLTGLPPTPEEVQAFLTDKRPDAFARVVDRLLESPHYGERWARHWLDLVRYAETNGHEYDNDKHEPWRYRDYVIRAFNSDLPYNQFVREHIAGDLLAEKRLRSDGAAYESPVGTSFFWFGEVLNSATDSEKSRADEVDNQIDVMSKAFLGLTVACARCHDHKFDPIPTADYYSLAGIMHSTEFREASIDSAERVAKQQKLSARVREIDRELGLINQAPKGETTDFSTWIPQGPAFGLASVKGAADSRVAGSDVFMGTLTSRRFRTGKELYLHVRISGTKTDPKLKELAPLRLTIVNAGFKSQNVFPEGDKPVWKTLTLTFERERTVYLEIVDRSRQGHVVVHDVVFSNSKEPPATPAPDEQSASAQEHKQALLDEKANLEAQVPDSEFAAVAEDYQPHDVRIHIRGNHQNLGAVVPRRSLSCVAGSKNTAAGPDSSGRLLLAEKMASPDNPLVARVMVNRIWKHHFGQGLVKSTDNFGKMGEAPSHPELLDYLATRFVAEGWSVKKLHRMILLTDSYTRSSTPSEQAKATDPQNKYLQHFSVERLEGEAIRDSMLAVSGSLNPALFGPSVTPFISSYQQGRGKPESGPLDGNGRRSIYVGVRRNFMTPMFLAFDYPLPISTIGSRTVSTVPSQALLMMNNEFVAQQASRWAAVVIRNNANEAERIGLMYEAAFARPAAPDELEKIRSFVRAQEGRPETDVWADVAHVLLNSPEFIYLR